MATCPIVTFTSQRDLYSFDPDSHALSVVSKNVLITVNQEYQGVYLKTFNLITGYNTDRQYVSEAAMNLIPPLGLENLPDNKVQLTFYAKECEKGDVVKFVYVLRAGWDIDNSRSTIEKIHVISDPGCKVLYVHKFGGDEYPSLVVSQNGRVSRYILDRESDRIRSNAIGMYRVGFTDDRQWSAMICKGEDFVVVDDKLSKFYHRRGGNFNTPVCYHLSKRAVTMQMEHNRGQFFVAVNREELYVVNRRASRFTKIPLPEGRLIGAGLVFNANDDLILTDKEGLNPVPYRLPSRGIPSLQTISCLKVVSMSPEETLFESREVDSTHELLRVLFMCKRERLAHSSHLLLPPSVDEPFPALEKPLVRFSPLYRMAQEPNAF